jgi:tetratricopeptide (TPR) repeat protein
MSTKGVLDRGRELFQKNAWPEAYEVLYSADQESPLEAPDLDVLAVCAYMIGKEQEARVLQERTHHAFLEQDEVERAARTALWLGMNLMQTGDFAQGGGWIGRARRLIEEPWRDCVEQGWVLLPNGIQAFAQGEYEAAFDIFAQAVAIGERFGDPSLTALARHGQGRALINGGNLEKGLPLLDEAMVQVTSDDVYPVAVGIVYCGVIDTCRDIFDLKRAQEWTAALTRWSQSQPDLVPFRGQCLVFRAEFMELHGAWTDALEQSALAAARLSEPPPHEAAGAAFYQEAELHRLQGKFSEAEEAYQKARELGRNPQPGLALLRLSQGRVDVAEAAIRAAIDEVQARPARCRMLPAFVEIMLATGDVASARASVDELNGLA